MDSPPSRSTSTSTSTSTSQKVVPKGPSRELLNRSSFTASDLTDALYLIGNDPSQGLYHVQSHIDRSVPEMVNCRLGMESTTRKLQELSSALDEMSPAVAGLSLSVPVIELCLQKARESTDVLKYIRERRLSTSVAAVGGDLLDVEDGIASPPHPASVEGGG